MSVTGSGAVYLYADGLTFFAGYCVFHGSIVAEEEIRKKATDKKEDFYYGIEYIRKCKFNSDDLEQVAGGTGEEGGASDNPTPTRTKPYFYNNNAICVCGNTLACVDNCRGTKTFEHNTDYPGYNNCKSRWVYDYGWWTKIG